MAAMPKKPWVAFLLSILLTGAGLAYLGKWGWAVLNLAVAIVAVVIAQNIFPELAAPLGIGIACGSAVLAKNLAEKMNKEVAARSANAEQISVPVIKVAENNFSTQPAEPVLVKPATVVCPKCASPTEIANFCAECGASLTPVG